MMVKQGCFSLIAWASSGAEVSPCSVKPACHGVISNEASYSYMQ